MEENFNEHVSREPNFRYTTVLQMKTVRKKKIYIYIHIFFFYLYIYIYIYVHQNVSREPDFRYTTMFVKKMNGNDRTCSKTYRKHTHIPQNRKSRKIWVSRVSGVIFAKERVFLSKNQLLHNCSCKS